ncbi:regulator [Lysinibacillus sp. BF-4]|uniref:RraA family protein n=1 Tax=Lysinibacillus sp. BF-4 TaxID=1473546 RepID=UPI0005078960|nr:RraA family protein [Lysinibacillus sp. BF-4]KFL42727.1 regulator [Lysinibacillus sp. BF-4]
MIKRLQQLPTTAVSDATGGHTNVNHAIKPLDSAWHIAGRAVTVRLPDGENGAVLEAIKGATHGDILVIDAKGNTNRAVAGDFVASLAKGVGIAGFIVDGVIRDSQAMIAMGFPVFSRGTTVAAGVKNGGGQVNVPVAIGGVSVQPGDYIVADADGVAVIAQADIAHIIAKAEDKILKDEAREQQAHANGEASIRAYLDKVVK